MSGFTIILLKEQHVQRNFRNAIVTCVSPYNIYNYNIQVLYFTSNEEIALKIKFRTIK